MKEIQDSGIRYKDKQTDNKIQEQRIYGPCRSHDKTKYLQRKGIYDGKDAEAGIQNKDSGKVRYRPEM